MNSIKAISQLENLKQDRLSFIHNNKLDEVYLEDIKAISLAIKALKKCPDIQDNSFKCRMCGKELKTWKSIRRSAMNPKPHPLVYGGTKGLMASRFRSCVRILKPTF